jgi:hypothetical protein
LRNRLNTGVPNPHMNHGIGYPAIRKRMARGNTALFIFKKRGGIPPNLAKPIPSESAQYNHGPQQIASAKVMPRCRGLSPRFFASTLSLSRGYNAFHESHDYDRPYSAGCFLQKTSCPKAFAIWVGSSCRFSAGKRFGCVGGV